MKAFPSDALPEGSNCIPLVFMASFNMLMAKLKLVAKQGWGRNAFSKQNLSTLEGVKAVMKRIWRELTSEYLRVPEIIVAIK